MTEQVSIIWPLGPIFFFTYFGLPKYLLVKLVLEIVSADHCAMAAT